MRKTFVDTLAEISRKDERVMCIIGDTGFSVFEEYEREFGDRFINVGIAEQNFVSFGAGLAAMGMKPFIYNVASFMVYRAFEQIELDICYQENPVVLVGVGGGHAYGTAGPTHHAYFDMALMSQLPNMTVISPADPVEMRGAMFAVHQYNKPAYIRIGRSIDPVVHEQAIDFQIGKAVKILEGSDVVIFATGTMVKDAVKTCSLLKERNINPALYSMPTIKPIDKDIVGYYASKNIPIFTMEEHSIKGGLGGAVGDFILEYGKGGNILYRFGFPDTFAPVTGTREYLNELYGMGAATMADQIMARLDEWS